MRTRRTYITAAMVSSSALLLTACGSAAAGPDSRDEDSTAEDTITVEHAQGTTDVAANPESVVVFDYGSLDTLDALEVDITGVPQDNLPDFLSDYGGDDYEDVGTLFEPDLEAINAIDPDLIIVAARSADAYDDLSEHWPTIDMTVDFDNFLDDLQQQTQTLGEIFDHDDAATEQWETLEATIDDVRELTVDADPGLILSTSGGEVTVFGEDSRFGLIHSVLGVPTAVNDVEPLPHGEAISFEMIRDTDPDWLFVNDRDAAIGESGASAEAILDNDLVHATGAWESDQVVYLDAQRWYIVMSGVRNANEMFTQIGDAFEEKN